MTLDLFEPHTGTAFALRVDEPPFEALTLTETAALPAHAGPNGEAPPREPFSLLFEGPPEPALLQQTVPLTHEEMGDLDLFLVPIGPGAEGQQRYEAIVA